MKTSLIIIPGGAPKVREELHGAAENG